MVASFVVPSLEKSLASGVTLVKAAAPLPLDPTAVRDMLLNQAGLPPEVTKYLDLTSPIAGASVVGWPGGGPLNAFAFGVRSPGDAVPLLAALGRTVGRRGAAVQIENAAGDRGWFWPEGNAVMFADSEDALARAGSLAQETRRAAHDDLVVAIVPEMMARAAGTELKAIVTRFVGDIEARAAASGTKLGPEAMRQLRVFGDYLLETQTAELALNLDSGRGAALVARLLPRAGSKLEAIARHTKPAPMDPLITASVRDPKNGAGFVLSSAYAGATLDQLRRQRARLPATGGKPVATAGRLLDALIEGLTGEFWLLGRARPNLSSEMVLQARDAAAAGRIQTALAATNKEAIVALVRAATEGEGVDLKVRKAQAVSFGKSRGVSMTVAVGATAGKGNAGWGLRKLLGPNGVELFAAVIPGDRLAMAMGPGARARIAALTSGRPATTPPAKTEKAGKPEKAADTANPAGSDGALLAATLGNVGARSLFYLLDLKQALAVSSAAGGDPRLAMLAAAATAAPVPVFGGLAGDGQGRTLTLDLTLPPAAFAGIGGMVQAATMMPRR